MIAAAVGVAYGSASCSAFVRAGRVLRQHGHARIRTEPPRGRRPLPLRDAFAVLFFVSVGMLFDPATLVNEPLHVFWW